MRTIVIAIVVLVAGVSLLRAAEPPELEEWFRLSGGLSGAKGNFFCYLPNFDTVSGHQGHNATSVSGIPRMPTWYNRYQGDTENQYEWGYYTRDIRQADLNGDGVVEYITRTGRVHRGIGNGVPPEKEFTDYGNIVTSLLPFYFHDIDEDGYTDAIADQGYFSPPWLFTILWGGPDLTQLRTQVVYRRPYAEPKVTEFLAAVLPQKSAEGKVRIITRSYEASGFQQAKWISYVLRELTPIHEADTVRFEIATLDSISDAELRPAGEFDLFDGMVFQSRQDQPLLFLTAVRGRNSVQVYCLDEGRFRKTQEFTPSRLFAYDMNGSINGDDYRDLKITGGSDRYYYAGGRGETLDTIAFGYSSRACEVTESFVDDAIGDVTGDGVGDIGEAYNNDTGCFRILKGVSNRAVGVDAPVAGFVHRPFDMNQNYPNPVGSDRRTILPFSTEKPQHLVLALYDLSGRFIGELFSGYVPEGDHEVELDFARYHLAPGMYVLRLGNGEFVRERGIQFQ